MYNFHSHTLLSDGVLLPSEVAMRYAAKGYKAIAITDHADYSNIDFIISSVLAFTRRWPKNSCIKVFPGIELTHIPGNQFKPLVAYARKKGIKVIIGHGETLTEPVEKGTNNAAIRSGIDILAHPGQISAEDVKLAKKHGVYLEITSRKSHNQTNTHVAKMALRYGAKLILNNDSHSPEDIITPRELKNTGIKAGLNQKNLKSIDINMEEFIKEKENAR